MREKQNTTQRALNILKVLKGKSLTGLTNKELSQAINDSAVNTTRAVAILVQEGFVQKLETERYALSYQFLQIAVAHESEMQKAAERLAEIRSRVQAGAF